MYLLWRYIHDMCIIIALGGQIRGHGLKGVHPLFNVTPPTITTYLERIYKEYVQCMMHDVGCLRYIGCI